MGKNYVVDFSSMQQINRDTFGKRRVIRSYTDPNVVPPPSVGASTGLPAVPVSQFAPQAQQSVGGGQVVWSWHDDTNWQPFDQNTQAELEAHFLGGQRKVSLTQGYFAGKSYIVDFKYGFQKNLASGAKRPVQRLENGFPTSLQDYQTGGKASASVGLSPSGPASGFALAASSGTVPTGAAPLPSLIPTALPGGQGIWEWKGDQGWVAYDAATSQEVERAYLSRVPQAKLTQGFFAAHQGYFVDFNFMLQVSAVGNQRQIRRR